MAAAVVADEAAAAPGPALVPGRVPVRAPRSPALVPGPARAPSPAASSATSRVLASGPLAAQTQTRGG